LTVVGVAIAAGNLALLAVCWRSRTVLGGLLAAIGVALVGLAIASGPGRGAGGVALLSAGVALVIGTVLFAIGQAVQRLLDDEPEEWSDDR
jgi:hypothetical protein